MLIPTRDNAAILFLDLQEEIIKSSHTRAVPKLELAASGLAKLAALHQIPAFLSAVPPGGAFSPAVTSVLPGNAPRMRTQTSAFADAGLVEALKASGRKALILSGVASEIVVQRTALDALRRRLHRVRRRRRLWRRGPPHRGRRVSAHCGRRRRDNLSDHLRRRDCRGLHDRNRRRQFGILYSLLGA